MNRIEIIELVQQHHPHMAEVEILKLINRAMDDFTMRTECLKRYKDIGDTIAGTRYYPSVNNELTSTAIGGDTDILKILNVWIDDVLTPRIVSKDEAMLIDDDEYANPDNTLSSPSATSNEKYWYPINDSGIRLGIVEKSKRAHTRDDKISDYQSISESGLQIRAHYISRGTYLVTGSDSGATYIPEISVMWHPALVSKAIADGYKDIRNQKFDAAQFFTMEYEDYVKKAKKQSRSGSIVTGHVVPHAF